jgi:xylulokinase
MRGDDCLVLAIDVGTSGVKAVLASSRHGIVGSRQRSYPLHTPRPGWVEQDPMEIRAALVAATRELLDASTSATTDIEGVVLTAQMFSVQPVDAAGEPVGPMLSWLDQRAAGEAADLALRVPPGRQFEAAGSVVTAKDIVPRILWLRHQAPDTWARSSWLLDCKEAMIAWMTGRAVTDAAGASAYRLTDHRAADWDPVLCELLGVPLDRLPEVAPATSVAGGLRPRAAAAMGLPVGLPVFVGAGDVPASQVGSGAIHPGDAHLSLGTAIYLGFHTDVPLDDPARSLGILGHAIPDAWILWLEIATGGAALTWITRALGDPARPDAVIDHTLIERLVSSVADDTDDLLFAPWLSGERVPLFDDDARGAFVGLALRHGRAHLVRAVMEGVAYQIRWAYEYGLAYGVAPGSVRAVGGGGLGDAWLGIIADTLGRPIEVVDAPQDAAALGAAAMAFVGLGVWPAFDTVADHVRVARTIIPETERARRRDQGFARFRTLHDALAPIFRDLVAAANDRGDR